MSIKFRLLYNKKNLRSTVNEGFFKPVISGILNDLFIESQVVWLFAHRW